MKDEDLNKITGAVVRAIDARLNKKPASYYSEAQVLRVDEKNGVAYVHIPGGVDETPVKLTIDAAKGDTVQIRVGEGSATIVGNQTAPPTDDKLAEEALQEAETAASGLQEIDEALENGDFDAAEISNVVTWYCMSTSNSSFNKATGYDWQTTIPTYTAGLYYWTKTVTTLDDGTEVETDPIFDLTAQAAAEADAIATSNGNHFWHNGTGVYVTKTANNASSGYATRIVSEGIQHTYNGNPLFTLSSSALTFNQSDGTTPMATYGSGGTTLYANGDKAAEFLTGGINLYDPSSTTYPAAQFLNSGAVIGKENAKHIIVDSTGIRGVQGSYDGMLLSFGGTNTQTTAKLQSALRSGSTNQATFEAQSTGSSTSIDIRATRSGVSDEYIWLYNSQYGRNIEIDTDQFVIDYYGNVTITNKLTTGALNNSVFDTSEVSLSQSNATAGTNYEITSTSGQTGTSKSGYYPLGVVGYSVATSGTYSRGAYLSAQSSGECTVKARIYANTSGTKNCTVTVLWLKTSV